VVFACLSSYRQPFPHINESLYFDMSNQGDPAARDNIRNETERRHKDNVNVENGDLGAWEYFIRTYDHGATMDESENGGTVATAAQTRQENTFHSAATQSKQVVSEVGSANHFLHPMQSTSGAFMNGSSMPNNHWRFHTQFGNYATQSTPSFASDTVITDLSSMINSQRSWSFPQLTNHTMHPPDKASAPPPSLLPLYTQVLDSINEAALHHHQQYITLLHEQNSAANISLSQANLDRYHHASIQHPENVNNLSEVSLDLNRISSSAGTSRYVNNKAIPQGDNHISPSACDDVTNGASKADIFDIQIPIFAEQITPPYQEHGNPRLLLKPLTPYNYYYRDERENIVGHITQKEDQFPPPISDFSTSKMYKLLYQHWYVDPVKQKRIHRKSHGKVSFESLSKAISKRWHDLPLEGRAFYRNVSLTDNAYFQNHSRRIQELRLRSLTSTSSTAAEERGSDDDLLKEGVSRNS
jgi:hypothetical protein